MLEIDHGSTRYCTCTPWQIVSQDLLQFTSHNESDRLSEFSPPHNAGSSSAKCVGKLMVTNTLRSNQARIFSPAPTIEQSQLALIVNYLMQMLTKQPFFILS